MKQEDEEEEEQISIKIGTHFEGRAGNDRAQCPKTVE